jgi:BlaI family penicillinase repressor
LELDLPVTSRRRIRPDVTATLTRREREILDIIYRLGEATVEQIRTELTGAPHYSTVRALLRVLEEKGHLSHGEQSLRYVYRPILPKQRAARLALDRVIETFFDSSVENVLRALLAGMSREQLDRAQQILDGARRTTAGSRLVAF